MNKYIALGCLIMLLLASCGSEEPTLLDSESYQVESNLVTEGEFLAEIISPTEIRSNYRSTHKEGISRYVDVKFSINGEDNELPFAVNHRMIIRPQNGRFQSPLFVFGQRDRLEAKRPAYGDFLEANSRVEIRLDFRPILQQFENQGFATLLDGSKIKKEDFKALYVAGSREPLTWDWNELKQNDALKMTDEDGDGIYTLDLLFNPQTKANKKAAKERSWKLSTDLSGLPQYQSDHLILDAMHNLSLEEMLLNIQEDSTFMAGKKWPGVWTRDISYSILLSLAYLEPEAAKKSLKAKVKNGRIVQDTGTGGSWPISTDRMTWVLAAWELYLVTGDQAWLEYIHPIIRQSAEEDLKVAWDAEMGLFHGESSFLDWREQSYPKWMQPIDIYGSFALGTNAVMYRSYEILAKIERRLDIPSHKRYQKIADRVKDGINAYFWDEEKGYYGQFVYGGTQTPVTSFRYETLGESLCILFGIANQQQAHSILQNGPKLAYGVPCIYPQIPEIPPYHNNGVWPFVQAYFTLAAMKMNEGAIVKYGFASMYRQAALFLTNKENLVASTGDYGGTEINSDRQLWSVAGNLAMTYRIMLGMTFEVDSLHFHPYIPEYFKANQRLENFVYRDAVLSIEVKGHGPQVSYVSLDGERLKGQAIPANLTGKHQVSIQMSNATVPHRRFRLANNDTSLLSPQLSRIENQLVWDKQKNTRYYRVYRNGEIVSEQNKPSYSFEPSKKRVMYQVSAVSNNLTESFLSEPVWIWPEKAIDVQPSPRLNRTENKYKDYTGSGYLHMKPNKNRRAEMARYITKPGVYRVDVRYANGNGPINTENKCAIRMLSIENVNGQSILRKSPIIMPQIGDQKWDKWGYSNALLVELQEGMNGFYLEYTPECRNMNEQDNEVLIDHLRLQFVRPLKR